MPEVILSNCWKYTPGLQPPHPRSKNHIGKLMPDVNPVVMFYTNNPLKAHGIFTSKGLSLGPGIPTRASLERPTVGFAVGGLESYTPCS